MRDWYFKAKQQALFECQKIWGQRSPGLGLNIRRRLHRLRSTPTLHFTCSSAGNGRTSDGYLELTRVTSPMCFFFIYIQKAGSFLDRVHSAAILLGLACKKTVINPTVGKFAMWSWYVICTYTIYDPRTAIGVALFCHVFKNLFTALNFGFHVFAIKIASVNLYVKHHLQKKKTHHKSIFHPEPQTL